MPPLDCRKIKPGKKVKEREGTIAAELRGAIDKVLRQYPSEDLTMADIAKISVAKGYVSARIYHKLLSQLLPSAMGDQARAAMKNVGTDDSPKMTRKYGCYKVEQPTEDGEHLPTKPCWKLWEDMTRPQFVSALKLLYANWKAAKKQAIVTLWYCNKLLVQQGEEPIESEELI